MFACMLHLEFQKSTNAALQQAEVHISSRFQDANVDLIDCSNSQSSADASKTNLPSSGKSVQRTKPSNQHNGTAEPANARD